jgi:hypothetical protein
MLRMLGQVTITTSNDLIHVVGTILLGDKLWQY